MSLRQYQAHGVEQIRQHFRQGSKRVLYCLPTSGGKTVIADYVISNAAAKGGKALFLAARRELIHQASKRISTQHGVILSGDKRVDPTASVQVASVQTLLNRELPFTPTLIFLDECHHSTAKTHQELLSRFPDTPVIGLSGSPVRASGMGLGDYFTSMVLGPGIEDLQRLGYIVPLKHLVGPQDKSLFADPVHMWMEKAKGRPTMAFCSSVEESVKLAERFNAMGIRAIHCDGTTESDERDQIPVKIASGEIQVACNFAVWVEGVDIPSISCVIFDRKTSSIAVYLQAAGRGLRIAPGKEDLLFLDHGGNLYAHGRIDQNRQWQLTKGRDVIAGPSTPDVDDKITVCPKCYTVAPPQATHCACGYKFFKKQKKSYKHKPGTLELHHDNGDVTMISQDKQRADFERFLWQQRNGRKKDGSPFSPRYAGFRFFQQFGIWPPREWER